MMTGELFEVKGDMLRVVYPGWTPHKYTEN